MKYAGLLICAAVLLAAAGCTAPAYERPTVAVDGIAVENVSLSSIDLLLSLTITNPNPVGATLENLSFDIFFLEGDRQQLLAHGERGGFPIEPSGATTVTVPVTVDNIRLITAFLRLARDGAVTFLVNGSATIDFTITSFDVPFTRTVEVRV
ncbi:LEA type 2 family protein [Methanoculleus sp. FWC-SCC1]|uniref:LEA type 2 family protein n=1 Tax=Methanoculleus frigidifontis TaxID=2584085 RepID=A0ABT8MDA9_9EURY|nr:LEA type 2 family protein [Methanoculleus sp. FWC-SCC1]MDN7025939.1 LEA type 2 family protein [Methanoculleus sp. FWC-SCC1]